MPLLKDVLFLLATAYPAFIITPHLPPRPDNTQPVVEGLYEPPNTYNAPPCLPTPPEQFIQASSTLAEITGFFGNKGYLYKDEHEKHGLLNTAASNRPLLETCKPTSNAPVTALNGPEDKSIYAKSHRGEPFSDVGCGYSGMPCTAFYYPYSTYDDSHDNKKVCIYNGYRQPNGETGDETDYKWNVMSAFPYISKSPLFGNLNSHATPFDDVETSLQIIKDKVVKVLLYGKKRITSISFVYKGGQSISHGRRRRGDEMSSIDLVEGEDIVEGNFSTCTVNGFTRVCGAALVTTKGQTISRGRFGKATYSTMSPNGFVFAGFFGRKGSNLHQIGLVAINRDAMNHASKGYQIQALDLAGWSITQFPGVAASSMYGGPIGANLNMGYRLPYNILYMKLNKLSLYGKGQYTGMRFTYDDGAEIDVGTTDGPSAMIDLGATGRIERITVTYYSVPCTECVTKVQNRTRGVIVNFIDKEGKRQSVSRGQVDLNVYIFRVLDVPKGMEIVAPLGGSHQDVMDNIDWLIRRSAPTTDVNGSLDTPSAAAIP